jgi:hypothetical protein
MLVLFAGLCRKVAEWPVYDAHDLIPENAQKDTIKWPKVKRTKKKDTMVHKTPNKKRSSNTDPTNIRGV